MDKPLADCMNALMHTHHKQHADTLLKIHVGGRLLVLHQDDILYFARERMNMRAYCTDGTSYVWRESFDHLLPRLKSDMFALCHRGYIVGLRHIRDVQWAVVPGHCAFQLYGFPLQNAEGVGLHSLQRIFARNPDVLFNLYTYGRYVEASLLCYN